MQKKIIPSKLQRWDFIWIISPSWPISKEFQNQFDNWVKFLEKLGFRIKIAKNTFSNSLGYSATIEEKVNDLHKMFSDKEVKAIICSQWWNNSNTILDYIDFELIKNNPKIFLGISDITVLINAIYKETWLITFHWNDLMWWFWREYNKYNEEEFINRLVDWKKWEINKNSEYICIKKWKAEWILIWWNTGCLLKMAWTKFFPNFKNKILFLEDFDESTPPDNFECFLYQLKQLWVFTEIKWLWLWKYNHISWIKYEQVVKNVLEDYDFPILKCDDFGHNTTNTVIPLWVKIELNATDKKVVILEEFVR